MFSVYVRQVYKDYREYTKVKSTYLWISFLKWNFFWRKNICGISNLILIYINILILIQLMAYYHDL